MRDEQRDRILLEAWMADNYDPRGGKRTCKYAPCGQTFHGFGDFCTFRCARAYTRRPKPTEPPKARKGKPGAGSH